jgi:hypothetical protein
MKAVRNGGSFRKVTRGRRAEIQTPSPVRHPKQGT